MTTNPHLIALFAYLTVGRRGPARLAKQTTIEPKLDAGELLETAATTLADVRREALAAAHPAAAQAVEAKATVERLLGEKNAHVNRRDDDHGPFRADRFWLTSLVGALIVVTVLLVAGALVIHGFTGTRVDALLVLVLATAVAAFAGDWAGRTRQRRSVHAAAGLVGVAILAAFAVGALHSWPPILFAVDLAVILTGAGAGYLAGRGRRIVPALRSAEREHTIDLEIAQASLAVRRADENVAAVEAEYEALVEEVGARVLRAVEEYLRQIDDERIQQGLFDKVTADDVRRTAREVVTAWPRTLDLAVR
jgi:hypothetical protein